MRKYRRHSLPVGSCTKSVRGTITSRYATDARSIVAFHGLVGVGHLVESTEGLYHGVGTKY
jgi:hypothetical protein